MSFTESLEDLVAQNPNGLLSAHTTWGRVPLGLVFDVQNGFPFESRYFNASGDGMPLLRIRDVVRGSTETHYSGKYDPAFVVNRGEIVVGMDGDFHCRVWQGAPALLNQRVCRLTPRSDRYSSALLAQVLQGYLDAVNGKTSAITVKHLSSETIKEIPLPLPPPREQERIVEVIDSYVTRLDDAVASLERVEAKLKAYRASVLKAAVEGRLVPTEASLARAEKRDYEPAEVLLARMLKERRRRWEEAELAKLKAAGKTPKDDKWKARYVEPVAPDGSTLPELPEGWCWTSLGQAFTVTVGATPSRSVPTYWNGDIPWVSSGEVSFRRIKGTKEAITSAGLDASSTKMNPRGSVLLGMIGEGKTRGQAAILDIDACGNQNAAAIWVSQTEVPPEYVYHYLVGQYETTRRRGSGNNQPALNKARVEAIPLPLPPVDEQRRIVERLERDESTIADSEATVEREWKRIHRLRQAILKWAFEGKLVDQDPTDEPAETLLSRIRTERATVSTPKKTLGRGARGAA
jgi:type I restriction enzyme S subunit